MHCCTLRKQIITSNTYDNILTAGKLFPHLLFMKGFGHPSSACVIIPVLKGGKLEGVCASYRFAISTYQAHFEAFLTLFPWQD